jgi:FkbM family methyltransferase
MNYSSRFRDLARKAWNYGLAAAERPGQLPDLLRSAFKGVHVGEFLRINQRWIREAGIKTVVDIGAHSGEFSSAIRAILPTAQIYAFEPLPECYERIRNRFKSDTRYRAFQNPLGENRGQIKFWRSNFSKASSVLPMADMHKAEFPWSSELEPIDVQVAKLDDFVRDIAIAPKVLAKIDVQGYEDRVIRGGSAFLRNVDYILTEISFRPLYEGQGSFDDVYHLLKGLGFSYKGNLDQLLSPRDRSVLQADALFVREDSKIDDFHGGSGK